MSYKKIELVKAALAEIGLSDYAFELSSDQIDQGLARLDAMMAEWNGRGIRLGYPISANPTDIDTDTDSGVPDVAYEPIITNLALRLAPAYGKTVNTMTQVVAARGMNTLFALAARPNPARLGLMPAGAGAKSRTPFIPVQDNPVVERPDASAQFE